jgi:hypothetical protein
VYKILLGSQVKEKPIAYTKWEKCLKKDRMHTCTLTECRPDASDLPNIVMIDNADTPITDFIVV